MTTGSAIPYHLRVNKSVDRELFLSLLTRLAPSLNLEGTSKNKHLPVLLRT